MSGPRVEVSATLLVYAFRYALGRRTGAPSDVAAALIEHRDALTEHERNQIGDEILAAIADGRAGDSCDVADWWRVLAAFGRAS